MQTTNQLMDYSIVTLYCMDNIWFFVIAGLLSYNLPQVFKLKSESGYLIRSGLMLLMSFAMIPVSMFMPEDYPILAKLLLWGCCFIGGIVFATYGARKLQARFSLLLSRFTVKNNIRKGSKTDIRYMAKELPSISNYNPLKYINLKKGIFVGLDEKVRPIYLQNLEDWYKRHFLIVGATRSGKGVAMQYLGIQSLMLGETVIFLDPKGDDYLAHIFKAECMSLNIPYNYIDLTSDQEQINLIADVNVRDLKNCFIEAFSQRELGNESDVYRKNEQEFLEKLANFIVDNQNSLNIRNAGNLGNNAINDNSTDINKSLAELCKEFGLSRYTDKFKSSVSDLNKLANVPAINAANGKSLAELIAGGGCIYILGDLLDETMKKIQRFIFCRIVQIARNYANSGNKRNMTVFADELVAHISRFVAESYAVTLGWGLKVVSAVQDLKLLRGAPADLDPEYLKGAIFGNSNNKLFYRVDDIDTADFLSDMTGRIQIEEEQKLVTRNSLNSEKLDRQTRLIPSDRNYFDRNMILNLKQFEAVFCASLSYRSTIACLCKTSPVKAPDNVNGKELTEVNPVLMTEQNGTSNNWSIKDYDNNDGYVNNSNQNQETTNPFKKQSNLQDGVINNEQSIKFPRVNKSGTGNNESRANSESDSIAASRWTADKKTSSSKSDYLF